MSQPSQNQKTTQEPQSEPIVPTFQRHSSCVVCGGELEVLWARDTFYGSVQRVACPHGHWYDRPA